MLFTTSWDDGHPLDLRIAELLDYFGAKGTFYLCRDGHGGRCLAKKDLSLMAKRHEFGAHTLTHPSLPSCSPSLLMDEIRGSKLWVENVINAECTMFAYPYGRYNMLVRDVVALAGFKGARTTHDLVWDMQDSFLLPTTLQLHHFPFRPVYDRRCIEPIRRLWPSIRAANIPITSCRSWQALARSAFAYALTREVPWFHLWGHSWSTDRYGLWKDLELFLGFVAQQPDIHFVHNSTLLSFTSPSEAKPQ